ncbi:MoaD family protein [Clostridium bovifaecis]|uniref:MoaD family protein n=1 Tax=Clostridium bovifaecis TaxID=2184719 RepID=A0A6I6EV70_9CLOT|nr:MoaD family protein [Clostridium bovifaecis]
MKVKFFAYIRDYTNCKETDFEYCETLEMLLRRLSEAYGEKFRNKVFQGNQLSKEVIILVNGRHIAHLDGISTKLNREDVVAIFPVVAGG